MLMSLATYARRYPVLNLLRASYSLCRPLVSCTRCTKPHWITVRNVFRAACFWNACYCRETMFEPLDMPGALIIAVSIYSAAFLAIYFLNSEQTRPPALTMTCKMTWLTNDIHPCMHHTLIFALGELKGAPLTWKLCGIGNSYKYY